MGEHHHLAAQFQGQVGETPVGAEDQMARAAAGRGRDECRIGRLQRTFGLFRGVAVDEYLVGAEVGGEQVLAVGRGHHRVHMTGNLARMHLAGLVRLHLHHRRQRAVRAHRQYRHRAFRLYRVVGDEQVAAVVAEAAVGRMIGEGLDLADLLQAAADRIETVGRGATDGIALAAPSVLVDHEQSALVRGEGQVRGVAGMGHAQRAFHRAVGAVEAVYLDAFAGAFGIGPHQQVVEAGGLGLGRHAGERREGQQAEGGQSSHGQLLGSLLF